jgi:cell division protein FtsN
MKKIIQVMAVLAVAAFALSGCFRKHIESAPPVRQPVRTEPAHQPVIEETHVVGDEKPLDGPVDEVYEVDAAKQAGTETPAVGETDLAEEPMPDAAQLKREAESAAAQETDQAAARAAEQAAASPAVPQAAVPAATPAAPATNPEDEVVGIGDVRQATGADSAATATASGPYYVQVGAFSDMENADRALKRLIADGYKGSVMIKTDEGLFRVQAGSFPDETAAGAALEELRTDYPNGFVLKKP